MLLRTQRPIRTLLSGNRLCQEGCLLDTLFFVSLPPGYSEKSHYKDNYLDRVGIPILESDLMLSLI